MLFLSPALVIISVAASVQAAGVLHTNVDCSQHKNATDTRICSFRFGIDTKADAKQPFKKECSGSKLMDLVDNCPVSSTVFQGNATLYEVKRQFSPECWVKQCTALDEYFPCIRAALWKSTSDSDYQAAAMLLVSDCNERGFKFDGDLGHVDPNHYQTKSESGASALAISAMAVVVAAAAAGVAVY